MKGKYIFIVNDVFGWRSIRVEDLFVEEVILNFSVSFVNFVGVSMMIIVSYYFFDFYVVWKCELNCVGLDGFFSYCVIFYSVLYGVMVFDVFINNFLCFVLVFVLYVGFLIFCMELCWMVLG